MDRINKQKVFNYVNRKNKWLGLIDYKTLVIFLVYCYLVIRFLSFLSLSFMYKLYICVNVIMPFVIFILLNLKEECIIDKLISIIKFLQKRKIYVNMKYYAKLYKIYTKAEEKNDIVKSKIK